MLTMLLTSSEAFTAKVTMGSFSTLNVSFDNADHVLELSTPRCSITPLLIDYGLEATVPFNINAVSNVEKALGEAAGDKAVHCASEPPRCLGGELGLNTPED